MWSPSRLPVAPPEQKLLPTDNDFHHQLSTLQQCCLTIASELSYDPKILFLLSKVLSISSQLLQHSLYLTHDLKLCEMRLALVLNSETHETKKDSKVTVTQPDILRSNSKHSPLNVDLNSSITGGSNSSRNKNDHHGINHHHHHHHHHNNNNNKKKKKEHNYTHSTSDFSPPLHPSSPDPLSFLSSPLTEQSDSSNSDDSDGNLHYPILSPLQLPLSASEILKNNNESGDEVGNEMSPLQLPLPSSVALDPSKSKGETHVNSKKRKSFEWVCDFEGCSASLSSKYCLQRHMDNCHEGRKPYECSQCNRKFAQRPTLKRHIQTHTGEKPFPCTKCDRRFGDKVNLNKHMDIQHSA